MWLTAASCKERGSEAMFIKQISVFLENRPGTLRELSALLGSGNIDIRELSVADTQHFGIVRLIISSESMDKAMALLKGAGYTARINNVICAEIDDKPSGLANLLTIIENENLSVEYMYSFRRTPDGRALMVLRLSEKERGLAVLNAYGVRLHTQAEVDSL